MVGPVIANFGSEEHEGAVPAADRQPRHLVGPGVLRARRRLRPRLAEVQGRPRRRRLGDQRPEDLDHPRPARRLDLRRSSAPTPRPKKQKGICCILCPMDAEGVTLRPIELIDGGHEVNEVFFEDVRVPGEHLVGEENQGWSYAKFLLGNERVGVAPVGATKRALATLKETAAATGQLEDPLVAAQIIELENELLALELTALRVVANSSDGKPHPASSVLKLKGTELQQAVSELMVDLGRSAGARLAARGDGSDIPDWARVAAPKYLNLRKASIYGGSNEIQRQIIAGTILGL